MAANGLNYDTQESKQTVFAIIKENGTAVIQQPGGAAIVYDDATDQTAYVFFVGATQVGRDGNKTINRTDVVGTQNQRVTEGSVEKSMSVDFLALRPAALGDSSVAFEGVGQIVHGLVADTVALGYEQYALTTLAIDKLIATTNTLTVRIFKDCDLDVNEDADITTAKEILDYEGVHLASFSESGPGGGDMSMSISLEAECVTFPAAYDALPN